MNQNTNRREFLRQSTEGSAIVAAATALGGMHLFADHKPAEIRLGIIGCNGIMTHHVKGLVSRREAVSIAWLCDVDPAQIDKMNAHVTREFQAALAEIAFRTRGRLDLDPKTERFTDCDEAHQLLGK